METMSYNKMKKRKTKSYGIYGFFTFIILGTGIVIYSIINEPTPVILGENPLKNVEVYSEDKENSGNIEYKVADKEINEKSNNFKANITLPVITVNGEVLTDINEEIEEYYANKANSLKSEMSGNVENKFTYKVTYKVYDNEFEDNKMASITIHERIIDDDAGTTTTDKVNGYNINLKEKKMYNQEDVALGILGTNYASLIKEQVKATVVGANMTAEDKYNYTVTGLEQFYLKDNKFHIILNESEVVDKSYGVVDIEITK